MAQQHTAKTGFQGNRKTRPYQDPTCFPLSADAADASKARGKEDDLESVDDHEDQVENIHDHDLGVNWMLWFRSWLSTGKDSKDEDKPR